MAAAEEAKLYNVQLERDLGGDNCHNVDRILRLPFTWNVPDARKIKKGRERALSSVLWWEDRKYPITTFHKALPVTATGGIAAASTIEVKVPGNIERVTDVATDKRLGNVKAWVKLVILNGKDIEGGHVWNSRSEALFAVVCELVRSEIPDELIYTIITDPDMGISASVLDKKNVEREATRVIGRAHEKNLDEDLYEMNQKYAVVQLGGKARVMSWEESQIYPGRYVMVFLTFEDFKNLHNNKRKLVIVEGQNKYFPMASWWLAHPNRKQYRGVIFAPYDDADIVKGQLNIWTGFYVAAAKGDCSLLLDHIRENVCGGDQKVYDYLIGWMARGVQLRDGPGEVAVVMRGRRGVGKGFLARTYGSLFGQHFLHIANAEHLVGHFNAHLQECFFLFADECFFAGDRRHEGILKTLITEPTLTIEPKGVNSFQVKNYIHMMMASNERFVVPAGEDERRFLVLDVAAGRIQDAEYFGAIKAQMDAGGLGAFLQFLMAIDLSNFDVRKVPQTAALDEQKRLTRRGIDALVETVAHDGLLPFAHHNTPDVAITSGCEKGRGFWAWARETFPDLRFWKPESMAAELKSNWGCRRWRGHGVRGIRFPPLDVMRAAFDKRHGPQAWDTEVTEWEAPARPARDQDPGSTEIPF